MLSIRNFFRAACLLALLAVPVLGHADTLKLISSSSNPGGGDDIFPYNFSVNGSNSLTPLVCLNFDRSISVGEQWQVNASSIDLGSSQTAINYRADALLFYSFGKYGFSNSDTQYAIWSIFDPAVKSDSHFTANSQTLVDYAMQYAVNPGVINSGFFSNFVLYTPTSDQTGWTNGQPQEFIGAASLAATPEPSSLVLLGTGLISTAFSVRRRFQSAATIA